MIKLNIGVSPHNIRHYYIHNNMIAPAMSVLMQHRIILNKEIISFYENNVPKDEVDALNDFIDSIVGNNERAYVGISTGNKRNSGLEEIIEQVRKEIFKTLLIDAEEVEGYKVNGIDRVTIDNICNNDDIYKSSQLFKYSLPITNYQIRENEDNNDVINWLKFIMDGERKIVIQDPYIYTDNSIYAFKNYLSKAFSWQLTNIELYGSISESNTTEEAIKQEFRDNFYNSWNITLFDCSKFHPRCIQLDSLLISIDASLDFLGRNGRTKKTCRISISKDKAFELSVSHQIQL